MILARLLPLLLFAAPAWAQLTIHAIQYTTDPGGASPYVNQAVTVQGAVTAVEYPYPPLWLHSFFVSDSASGPWSGVMIAASASLDVAVGDWVEVSGTVQEYAGQTSIKNPAVTVLGLAPPISPTPVSAAQFASEAYEGILSGLQDVVVTAAEANGVWRVQDGSGEAAVGHAFDYAYVPQVGDSLYQVTGVGAFIGAVYRLEPRGDDDLVFSGNPRPAISGIERYPSAPTPSDSVLVRAVVVDDDELARIELHFSTDGGASWDSLEMAADSSQYSAWIAPQAQGAAVSWFVLAQDVEGAIARQPDPPAAYVVAAPRVSLPIDSLVVNLSQFIDESVSIEGLVTYAMEWITSGGTPRITAYLQDVSGRGIELSESGSLADFPGIERGSYISLEGTAGVFEGSAQLSEFGAEDVDIIYPDLPLSIIESEVRRTGNNENEELLWTDYPFPDVVAAGTWCYFQGYVTSVEYAGGGANITLNDGSGPLVVRIWDDMGVPGAVVGGDTVAFPDLIGQTVAVAGAASWYSGFQIEVGYAEDIQGEEPISPASPAADLWVEPNPFVPDRGETITIRFNAPAGSYYRLRLLNLKGQLAALIREGQSGGGYEIEWDGRDELHRFVPVGVYILQMQATQNGRTSSAQAPVVVGTRLK